MWHLRILQFSLYRIHYLAESHAFPHEVSAYLYIYIYIYILHRKFCNILNITITNIIEKSLISFIWIVLLALDNSETLVQRTMRSSCLITCKHSKRAWREYLENESMPCRENSAKVEVKETRVELGHFSLKASNYREWWRIYNSNLYVLIDGDGEKGGRTGKRGGRTWRTCWF